MKRSPMRRSGRVGDAARARIQAGGPQAKGRPALSKAGYAAMSRMILGRAGGRCEACGERKGLHLEHAVPRSARGGDTWGNCWCTCQKCHRKKEAPYADGRLLVTAHDDGQFTFRFVLGSKVEFVVLGGAWAGGRVATAAELAKLAALR